MVTVAAADQTSLVDMASDERRKSSGRVVNRVSLETPCEQVSVQLRERIGAMERRDMRRSQLRSE